MTTSIERLIKTSIQNKSIIGKVGIGVICAGFALSTYGGESVNSDYQSQQNQGLTIEEMEVESPNDIKYFSKQYQIFQVCMPQIYQNGNRYVKELDCSEIITKSEDINI